MYDVCIIGGGASSSMLAILLAKNGKKVCVVDRFSKPAKKLLVTGNGRCNITNQNLSSEFYNQNIDNFLNKFGYQNTISFFESIGIDVYADGEGRCYPISNSAKSVQIAIINQFEKLKIKFFGESEAISCDYKNQAYNVKVKRISNETENGNSKTDIQKQSFKEFEICSTNLVIASGINDFAFDIFEKFNIKTNKVVPSLVALKTKQSTKKLDGVRISNVLVEAASMNSKKTEVGEVLFKDHGLSGICIFNLSSIFAKNKCFDGKISINLQKNASKSQIFENLYTKSQIFENTLDMLCSMFSKEISAEILERCKIDLQSKTKELKENQLQKIAFEIENFSFDVEGTYQNNQVLSGGVDLKCLTENLESKTQNGLFFCGEICDVDGVCGGYNLQWAWASAHAVAKGIENN